jgi:hypothetical protein
MLAQRYGCKATCNAVCTLLQLLADMLNPTKSTEGYSGQVPLCATICWKCFLTKASTH